MNRTTETLNLRLYGSQRLLTVIRTEGEHTEMLMDWLPAY